jgi:hypothetical protein
MRRNPHRKHVAWYRVGRPFGRGWRERKFNAAGGTTALCFGGVHGYSTDNRKRRSAIEAQDAPSDYEAHLVGRGQTEQFSFEGQSGAGTVKAVNADGALEMEWTPEGGRPRVLTVDRSHTLTWDWLWK